jgi:hypothetical protein
MNAEEFVGLMKYPSEWVQWKMLPEDVLRVQMSEYEPGSEQSSEHYRNGAFHFWLRQSPAKDVLIKLVQLSLLDPDPLMGKSIRSDCTATAAHADEEVLELVQQSDD